MLGKAFIIILQGTLFSPLDLSTLDLSVPVKKTTEQIKSEEQKLSNPCPNYSDQHPSRHGQWRGTPETAVNMKGHHLPPPHQQFSLRTPARLVAFARDRTVLRVNFMVPAQPSDFSRLLAKVGLEISDAFPTTTPGAGAIISIPLPAESDNQRRNLTAYSRPLVAATPFNDGAQA